MCPGFSLFIHTCITMKQLTRFTTCFNISWPGKREVNALDHANRCPMFDSHLWQGLIWVLVYRYVVYTFGQNHYWSLNVAIPSAVLFNTTHITYKNVSSYKSVLLNTEAEKRNSAGTHIYIVYNILFLNIFSIYAISPIYKA